MKQLLHVARQASPYLMVELLLPGGTLLAVLLYLYRRRRSQRSGTERTTASVSMPGLTS
jgi:hypothetical protein